MFVEMVYGLLRKNATMVTKLGVSIALSVLDTPAKTLSSPYLGATTTNVGTLSWSGQNNVTTITSMGAKTVKFSQGGTVDVTQGTVT